MTIVIIIIALCCVAVAYYLGRIVGMATGFSNAFRMLDRHNSATTLNADKKNTPAGIGEGAATLEMKWSGNQTRRRAASSMPRR